MFFRDLSLKLKSHKLQNRILENLEKLKSQFIRHCKCLLIKILVKNIKYHSLPQ